MEKDNETVINAQHEVPQKNAEVRTVVFTPDLQNNIHSLKLKNKAIHDFVLASIFQRVPSLKSLEFHNVQLLTTNQKFEHLAFFPREMISMLFVNSDFELLNFLNPTSATCIRISSNNLKQCPSLTTFLLHCKCLTKLELHGVNCDLMDFFKFPGCPFQLRYLSLSSSKLSREFEHFNEDGMSFLRHHANTLNFLEIRAQLPHEVLEFALKKLRMLRSLTLRLNLIPTQETFYNHRQPRKSVKTLTLEGPYIDLHQITAILKLYPATQGLSLDNFYVDFSPDLVAMVLDSASIQCPKLSELTISRIPFLPAHVEFNALNILRVKYINSIDEITSFFKNAKCLKALHIDFVFRHQLNQRSIDEILGCNITQLYITSEPFECYRIFEMIEKCPGKKLESLEIRAQAFTYFKHYTFSYKEDQRTKFQEMAERMDMELKDYLINEMFNAEEHGQNEDSVISDYVTNSFDFL